MLHDAQEPAESPVAPSGSLPASGGNEGQPNESQGESEKAKANLEALQSVAAPSIAAASPVPTAPAAATSQDRSLELAGLEALMKQHALRESPVPTPTAEPEKEVNWVTHKKEGMRLKRLMEESSDGAKYPHMQQMWSGTAAEPWISVYS